MTHVRLEEIHIPLVSDKLPVLEKGLYLVILHALRIPPHIGIIIHGKYHSLTLKGIETDIDSAVLLRTLHKTQTESIFFEINPHPVFSNNYLSDVFKEILKNYPRIIAGKVTCLNPVSTFFEEFYAVSHEKNDIIYTLVQKLNENGFILKAFLLNLNTGNKMVQLPVYTAEELNHKIKSITILTPDVY